MKCRINLIWFLKYFLLQLGYWLLVVSVVEPLAIENKSGLSPDKTSLFVIRYSLFLILP
ncbi:MAG TPA: hypothetical protein VGK46_00450 [Saprospiraceae bacterium]